MSNLKNVIVAAVVAVAVGGGAMAYDRLRGAEWVVSPEQIAEAKSQGKTGYESSPGTVTVLPIRSETADALPFRWAMYGAVAGLVSFFTLRRKNRAGR